MATMKQVIDGLSILAKYGGDHVAAEHDIIYAGPNEASAVSADDVKALDALGWFIDSESGCWATFV